MHVLGTDCWPRGKILDMAKNVASIVSILLSHRERNDSGYYQCEIEHLSDRISAIPSSGSGHAYHEDGLQFAHYTRHSTSNHPMA